MATRNYGVLCLFVVVFIIVPLTPLPASAAGNTVTTTSLGVISTPPITLGDKVTLIATVAATSGTPTGLVTFFDGTTPLGSGTLNGNPLNATFSTSLLALADVSLPHSITAVYNGDATFASSKSAPFPVTVQRRNSTTSLAPLSPATVVVGQPSTATVTVTDAGLSFPPGTTNTFAPTGAPATGRTGFTATLFGDGQVLVAGGTSTTGTVLQSAEIYSVAGAVFSATSNLNTARTGAVAVLLANGKVLIAGGSSDGTAGNALDTAELFDPVAGTFTLAGSGNANPNHMTAARIGHIGILLPNGQVLLAGGQNSGGVLSSAELYDPPTDTFTACGNLDTARSGAVALLLRTSSVLVAGGSSDGTAKGALNTAELFSVDATGAGSSLAISSTLSAARWQAEIALLPGVVLDNALIVGGQDSSGPLTSGDVYNIRVFPGTFHSVSNQMTVARSGGSAIALPNAEVLLAGGASSQHTELYDFGSNKFEAAADLAQSDNGLGGVLLNNGQVLTVGLTSGVTPASDAELYSPAFPPLGQANLSSTVSGDTFGSCSLVPGSGNASTCTASVTPAAAAVNPDVITATYQTDPVHATSNATASLSVTPAATVTNVFVTQTPTPFGQPVGFSAVVTVSSSGSTATPTGAVQFIVDGVNFGAPVPLSAVAVGNSNADSQTTNTLTVAGSPHTVTANYVNGDGNFINSSNSLPGGATITPAATVTAVVSSQNPSSFSQAVTFTAIVQDASGFSTAVPTGTVQFAVDGSTLGSPVPLTAASATTSTAVSPADSTLTISGSPHSVTATYVNADGNFASGNGSLSPGQSVAQAATTVAVTSSAIMATVGDTVTLTATVTNAGTGTPTGLVTFFDGTVPLGSTTLSGVPGNDQATFSTAVLNVPLPLPHEITAVYDGDANFTASPHSPAILQRFQARNTATSLVVNPTTVFVGQPTTATLTAADAGASAPPGTPDTFSSTGAPATGRTGFTITPLSDSQVLVAGGTDANGNVLQSTEIYSVSGAGFAAANGNLNTARTGAVAVLLPNGKVLVAGGSSDGTANGALASAELFDPLSGTFAPTSHNMTAARFGTTAILLNNGQVLLAGGENSGGVLSSAELYDPAADTFTATGSLNVARSGAAAVSLRFEGVIAGGSGDGTANGALDSIETFGFNSSGVGAFRLLTLHMSAPRWQPVAFVVQNFSGVVVIAGGENATGALTSADRLIATRISLDQVPNQMAVGRADFSALTMSNGETLLVGGASGSQIAEFYNFSGNRFVTAGNLLQSSNGLLATLLDNGQVLTVGLTNGATPASTAELYTPSFTPIGNIFLSSSEAGDGLSGFCVLLPTSNTASDCATNLTPVSVGTNPHVVTGFASSANVTVNPAATAIGIGSSASPSVFGQPVTLTATVTDTSPGSTASPTGTVQFVADGVNFGAPVALVRTTAGSSAAALSTNTLAVTGSPHSVSANFVSADGSFISSAGSLSNGQSVTATSTATAVVPTVSFPVYSQAVNFTATVSNTGTGSTGAPTGSVQFVVDGQNFGAPVALTAGANSSSATSAGIATLTVNAGSPHTVAANSLNADANFGSGSGSLRGGLQVSPAHLTVTALSDAVFYDNATFTLSAFLTGFVNGETETGLRSSGALSGTPGFTGPAVTAVDAGQYTIVPTQGTLAAANYDFPAANFVNGALIIVKAQATSLTTETATPLNDPVNGGSVSFVVVVTSTTSGTPTGSVQFTDDKNANLAALVSLSTASCPSGAPPTASCAKFTAAAGQLATGSQTITASYQGDANFLSASFGSTPSSVEVTVVPAINTTAGATIPPQVITFENGAALAAKNIALSCVVQAAAIPASSRFPTCSLSSTLLPQSGSVTVTLATAAPTNAGLTGTPATVASAHAQGIRPNPFSAAFGLQASGFLGLVLLTGKSRQRLGRNVHALLVLMLMLSMLLLVSCGGGSSPGPRTVGGTPTGTYLVSVVGNDVNHNPVVVATIPLNVQ